MSSVFGDGRMPELLLCHVHIQKPTIDGWATTVQEKGERTIGAAEIDYVNLHPMTVRPSVQQVQRQSTPQLPQSVHCSHTECNSVTRSARSRRSLTHRPSEAIKTNFEVGIKTSFLCDPLSRFANRFQKPPV